MKVFEANITYQVSDYLNSNLKNTPSYDLANKKMYDAFGIIHFFDNNEELNTLKEIISETQILSKSQIEQQNMEIFKQI